MKLGIGLDQENPKKEENIDEFMNNNQINLNIKFDPNLQIQDVSN